MFVPGDEEVVLDCVFDVPEHVTNPATGAADHEQTGSCISPRGEVVAFRVNDDEGGSAGGMRVFAGVRWDPFIMDARAALATIATRKLAFTESGSIFLDGKNVLSIVVEIDTELLGAGRSSVSWPRP